MCRKDVIQLTRNTIGDDYLIADLHGNAQIFNETLKKINFALGDRLFMLGDLFDRGENSPEVFKKIMEINQVYPGAICVIRGNHEDLLLKTVLFLGKKTQPNDAIEEGLRILISFFRNDGWWIFKAPLIANGLFKQILSHFRKNELTRLFERLADLNKQLIDEIDEIVTFAESLPYITLVGNLDSAEEIEKAFVIFHADMPFSDKELMSVLNGSGTLTDKQRHYCTWARESDYQSFRDSGSILGFCGHTTWYHATSPVRKSTNTCNLDAGTYFTNSIILVNATKRTVEYIANPGSPNVVPHFDDKLQALKKHLMQKPQHSNAPAQVAQRQVCKKTPSFNEYSDAIDNAILDEMFKGTGGKIEGWRWRGIEPGCITLQELIDYANQTVSNNFSRTMFQPKAPGEPTRSALRAIGTKNTRPGEIRIEQVRRDFYERMAGDFDITTPSSKK